MTLRHTATIAGVLLVVAACTARTASMSPAELTDFATRYVLLDHCIDEFPPVLDELDRLLELIARSRSE